MISKWPHSSWILDTNVNPHEADFLKLDISKAKEKLNWKPVWELNKSLERIVYWHKAWKNNEDMRLLSLAEIEKYLKDMNNEKY